MKFKVTITRISQKGPEDFIKEMDVLEKNIDKGLKQMAEQVRDNMFAAINDRTKRSSSGNLQKHIKVEKIPNGYGIGNQEVLDANAEYWRVVNYGGYVPPANLGYFEGHTPPGARGKDAWTHTGDKKDFLMVPKRPIVGIRYIEKAAHWLSNRWKSWMDKWIKPAFGPK